MAEADNRPIVVGVNYASPADAAVAWAAAEAARQGRPLELLHAYQATPPSYLLLKAVGKPAADPAVTAAALLSKMLRDVRATAHGVPVSGSIEEGNPVEVLLNASRSAAMVVVGWHRRQQFGQLWMPSVGTTVAGRADCPVAFVSGELALAANGPVVVGIEESAAGESALELAFLEAEVWQCGLLAIRACSPADHRTEPGLRCAGEAAEWQSLTQFVERWSAKYPDVEVESRLVVGAAADVLTSAGRTARMTVVGPRRDAPFRGPTLGGVGQRLLHCADGVLLVTHAGADQPTTF